MVKEHINHDNPRYPEASRMQESCLFRRGANMASPDEGFSDIIKVLKSFGKRNISILEVGTARGEELLSVLSVLHSQAELNQRLPENAVNVQVVDIRPPLSESEIVDTVTAFIVDHFFSGEAFLTKSLEKADSMDYRVIRIIKDFLVSELKKKQHWETDIRDYVNQPIDDTFDVILFNNTYGHIPDDENNSKYTVVEGLLRRLNAGGTLITDPYPNNALTVHPKSSELIKKFNLDEISPGIYQKRLNL